MIFRYNIYIETLDKLASLFNDREALLLLGNNSYKLFSLVRDLC